MPDVQSQGPPPFSKQFQRKRLHPLVVIGGILLGALMLAMAIGGFMALNTYHSITKEENAALAAEIRFVRDLGHPLTVEELETWYGEVQDEDNAALVIEEAYKHYRMFPGNQFPVPIINSLIPLEPTEPFSEEVLTRAKRFLGHNEECMRIARQALERPACSFGLEADEGGSGDSLLSKFDKIVSLFIVRGIEQAQGGHTEAATNTFIDCLRFADLLHDEPVYMAQLIRGSLTFDSLMALQKSINIVPFSEDQLTQLTAAAHMFSPKDCLDPGIVDERCTLVDGAIAEEHIPLLAKEADEIQIPWPLNRHLTQVLIPCREAIELTELPPHEAYIAFGSMLPDVDDADTSVFGIILNGPTAAFLSITGAGLLDGTAYISGVARQQVFLTGLAIERYRVAERKLPPNLQTLVPDFLPEIPIDPYTGEPLRFMTEGNNFKVYSVGRDGTDGGGTRGDIVFEVRRESQKLKDPASAPEAQPAQAQGEGRRFGRSTG